MRAMTLRSLMSVMLTLMLAITSQSMVMARGVSAATGQRVLCAGTGPVAVYMDAAGEPTSAPQICPDSALNVVVTGAASGLVVPVRFVQYPLSIGLIVRSAPKSPHPAPPSRGPPEAV